MPRDFTQDEIQAYFRQGYDCSQLVVMAWADDFGYEAEEGARMAASFGGGMFHGDTCGAVTGALIVLGLSYGHSKPDDIALKQELITKVASFQHEFAERAGSTVCRDLIPFDFSKHDREMEQAIASGRLHGTCAEYVSIALDILRKMSEDSKNS